MNEPHPPPRVAAWHANRNTVAIGNLGEQVALRVLHRNGYHILATQEDLRGGLVNILEAATRMNPEDFVCITPDGRLVTVNSKAAVSVRATGIDRTGNLRRPRLAAQASVQYTTARGALPSPVDGEIRLQRAQIFDIDHRGRLQPCSDIQDITGDVTAVLAAYPDGPPRAPSSLDIDATAN